MPSSILPVSAQLDPGGAGSGAAVGQLAHKTITTWGLLTGEARAFTTWSLHVGGVT
jgi:hypothetical protein